jgi:hypothetical protein
LSFRGFGYGAHESVNHYWSSPQVLPGSATADWLGHLSLANLAIPAGAPSGDKIVVGRGRSTGAKDGDLIAVQ